MCRACKGAHRPHTCEKRRKKLKGPSGDAEMPGPIPHVEEEEEVGPGAEAPGEPDATEADVAPAPEVASPLPDDVGEKEDLDLPAEKLSASADVPERPSASADVPGAGAPVPDIPSADHERDQADRDEAPLLLIPPALRRLHQRLLKDIELYKLHSKHYHMSPNQFKARTSELTLPDEVYEIRRRGQELQGLSSCHADSCTQQGVRDPRSEFW